MKPYILLDTATDHDSTLRLYQRGDEFSIRVDKAGELMNSRLHNSEDLLADFACAHISGKSNTQMLVGGLGLGYTLAAALLHTGERSKVMVAELMPAVVRWNRSYLGTLANHPLNNPRVEVHEQDVGKLMREHKNNFDAIMLDVDNGPDAFTCHDNHLLYGLRGLQNAYNALKPGGVLTVWSAVGSVDFTKRMQKTGFNVEEKRVRAHKNHTNSRHTIWIASRS
ncbi:MAG: MnmC family methyltransferase [Mariprofundus sp.]|nr:MnmC family methyltransferase [Mariprofundus sp.]